MLYSWNQQMRGKAKNNNDLLNHFNRTPRQIQMFNVRSDSSLQLSNHEHIFASLLDRQFLGLEVSLEQVDLKMMKDTQHLQSGRQKAVVFVVIVDTSEPNVQRELFMVQGS
jgi:hypothetical protein